MATHTVGSIGETSTLRDIVLWFPQAVKVFERYRIDYCCGGTTDLASAAQEHGLTAAELLEAIQKEVAVAQPSPEEERDWSAAPLAELADHIEKTHHAYLHHQMPVLMETMQKTLRAHQAAHGAELQHLLDVLWKLRVELDLHLRKEESVLFPAIRACEANVAAGSAAPSFPFGSLQTPIRQLESEHEEAGSALAKMRQITSNYQLPDDACTTFAALYAALEMLEADLHRHIHLENNILFPRAIAMEHSS